jgi:tetratricopeptide (TPR) repeat protein
MRWTTGFAIVLLCGALGAQTAPAQPAPDPEQQAQREYDAGRYSRAIDLLTSAIGQSPDSAPLHFLLGRSYYQLREFSRAVTHFERSVQLVPGRSEYHDWLGKAYGRKAEDSNFFSAFGWARKTHKEFETAVRLDPSNFEAQRDMIRFEMYAPGIVGGGDDKAQRHIAELEKLDPLQGQLARGEYLTAKKRLAEATALYDKILESPTDRIGVFFEVADFYQDHRNTEKMSRAVARAEQIDSENRRLQYYRGILLIMEKKNPGEAESLLKSFLATVPANTNLPPSHSSAHEWLGKLYESQGRFSEAASEYRAALSLDPDDKPAEEALKRLKQR